VGEWETSNNEHRTLNAEGARVEKPSAFDVRCSMFSYGTDACPALELLIYLQNRLALAVFPAMLALLLSRQNKLKH